MLQGFVAGTEHALQYEVLGVTAHAGPHIIMSHEFQCFVEAKVARGGMVMFLLKDLSAEVALVGAIVRDVYMVVQEEKTRGREGEARRGVAVDAELEFTLSKGVGGVAGLDVLNEGSRVDDQNGEINDSHCILCDVM